MLESGMKKLLERAILPPHAPLKNVQKIYDPLLTETAFLFLTNYMILELFKLLSHFLCMFFPGLYRMYCNNIHFCVKVTFTQ